MKEFFIHNTLLFFIIFSSFSEPKSKNSKIKVEKKFTFWNAFHKKLATLSDFEKVQGFFPKIPIYFFKNTQI